MEEENRNCNCGLNNLMNKNCNYTPDGINAAFGYNAALGITCTFHPDYHNYWYKIGHNSSSL